MASQTIQTCSIFVQMFGLICENPIEICAIKLKHGRVKFESQVKEQWDENTENIQGSSFESNTAPLS